MSQCTSDLSAFLPIGDKSGSATNVLFDNYSRGVATGRDAWCYNHSKLALAENIGRMINFYNAELDRFSEAHPGLDKKAREKLIDDFISADPTRISWTRSLKQDMAKGRNAALDDQCIVQALYRPFSKQFLYFSRQLNDMIYQMPRLYPDGTAQNRVICVSAPGCISGFTALMSNLPTELCFAAMKGGTQCFPLYLYDPIEAEELSQKGAMSDLFETAPQSSSGAAGYQRRDAITDEGLTHLQVAYPGERIGKEDIFYYVYGLLHSPDYRQRFADNLGKELPRIPCVKKAADFWAFAEAGRTLADLHVDYENVIPYPATITGEGDDVSYRVEKMRYGGKGGKDKSILHYNDRIAVTGIPLEAYEYVVNGKPALDWVVERQCVKTDKDSGIVNDANDWAVETMGNPRYPLELFLRVITVSLETMKIVKALPPLDID